MSDRIAQLQKLLAAEPQDVLCLYGLAQEYAKTGDHRAAIEFYDRVIAVDPHYHYAYFHKARCEEGAGDMLGAIRTLQAGLKRASTAGDAKAAGEIRAFIDQLT